MIINATSHTIRKIWILFLFIFIIFTIVYVTLTLGIRINTLNLPSLKVKQLYIKLDKKLIVSAKSVDINYQSKNQTSLLEIQSLKNKLYYLNTIFESISILDLKLKNKTIHFLYKDKIFYIDSDYLTIDAKINSWQNNIEINIRQMLLKDYNFEAIGTININQHSKNMDFKGKILTHNISLNSTLRIENEKLYYRLSSQKFDTLKPFMDDLSKQINLEPLISTWIYKKITANSYKLNNLEGVINLKTKNIYPNLIKGSAEAKNVYIKFDENVPAAFVKDAKVILENDSLIFKAKTGIYENKNITLNDVHIYNLIGEGTGIIVDISTNALLDEKIHTVLKAYDINVPITQLSGKTNARVVLNVLFEPISVKSYIGLFEINDANILLSGIPMYTKHALVRMDNNLLHVNNSNLKYKSLFDINTSGEFDTSIGVFNAQSIINSLNIGIKKNSLLSIKDLKTPAILTYDNKKTIINLKKLDTNLIFKEKSNDIIISNLSKILPYSSLFGDLNISNGNIKISTKDFNNFEANSDLNISLPLADKSGQKINNISLHVEVKNSVIDAKTKDKNLSVHFDKKLFVNISDNDVIVNLSKEDDYNTKININLSGENSNILDSNSSKILLSDTYYLSIDKNTTTFNSFYKNNKLSFFQNNDAIKINGNNFSSIFINALLGKEIFKNGVFGLNANGKNLDNLNGKFIIKNTIISDVSSYNNLIALINTIPSLLTFKNPGFNEHGYEIKDGFIDFSKKENILNFDKINLDGTSTDIVGKGYINLKTEKIDFDIKLSVLKSASSFIKNIPILNYIILGKDNKFYTNIKISGTLSDMKITTNVVGNSIIAPLNIIKRTLETPIKIFQTK